ncbi:1-acyl-sn-glycerol-3-phosphate acyltransferase [Rubidibacter lacunae KORDI 51-2]|uniref:1-acyl-sn-glycerol-3-phosphate acyltransferase n=1 Tax=Rubidibacter lacunae KORDI 51-2 TaxID=582515 RepID=U5DGU5_9CHRO|nr:lysophospholipid acyltransferase family protein [Rubidibacter lacunae]ERN40821.1 1-acyl-sn-glycerol-3-phosphate acyltransferase [Rubidibacter lacunae KORDI 51-2]
MQLGRHLGSPLQVARGLVALMGTRLSVYYENRIPQESAVVVVSNHRSFMDPALLMVGLQKSLRTACHHYMNEVPVMREFVRVLGCFPLAAPGDRRSDFLRRASGLLHSRQWVAVFPEGARSMVATPPPTQMRPFQRGFAHLLLRAPVPNLAVLPVAIAAREETVRPIVPLRALRVFDNTEPLFDRPEWHPIATYQRANLLVGRPVWIAPHHYRRYHGRSAHRVVSDLSDYCREEIGKLLVLGCR